jgi:hypothetical protein
MKLNEVTDFQDGHYNPEADQFHKAEKTDTRRPRLSLEHLNKIRKMREIRKLETEQRKELYKTIYARPAAM